MATRLHWAPQRFPIWVGNTILMVIILLMMEVERRLGAHWWGQGYLLLLWANLLVFWRRRLYVLTGGVLLAVQPPLAPQTVPLAGAEAKRLRTEWYIRWMDGKRPQSLRIKHDPGFDPLLEQALSLARAEKSSPRTAPEARARVAVAAAAVHGRPLIMALAVAMLALSGVALWLNLPLVLAPLLLLPYLAHRYAGDRYYVIAPDGLWATAADGAPICISPEQITAVSGRKVTQIATSHPELPLVRVQTATSTDFLRILNRMMAGRAGQAPEGPRLPADTAPAAPADTAPDMAPAPAPAIRCALCGRPMATGLAPAGSVHICETCAHRARYEAQESGHGPGARPERPIG